MSILNCWPLRQFHIFKKKQTQWQEEQQLEYHQVNGNRENALLQNNKPPEWLPGKRTIENKRMFPLNLMRSNSWQRLKRSRLTLN